MLLPFPKQDQRVARFPSRVLAGLLPSSPLAVTETGFSSCSSSLGFSSSLTTSDGGGGVGSGLGPGSGGEGGVVAAGGAAAAASLFLVTCLSEISVKSTLLKPSTLHRSL